MVGNSTNARSTSGGRHSRSLLLVCVTAFECRVVGHDKVREHKAYKTYRVCSRLDTAPIFVRPVNNLSQNST